MSPENTEEQKALPASAGPAQPSPAQTSPLWLCPSSCHPLGPWAQSPLSLPLSSQPSLCPSNTVAGCRLPRTIANIRWTPSVPSQGLPRCPMARAQTREPRLEGSHLPHSKGQQRADLRFELRHRLQSLSCTCPEQPRQGCTHTLPTAPLRPPLVGMEPALDPIFSRASLCVAPHPAPGCSGRLSPVLLKAPEAGPAG